MVIQACCCDHSREVTVHAPRTTLYNQPPSSHDEMNWVAVMIALTRFVKKSEFILLGWSQQPWAWTWDILFFLVFSHTGHVPAPSLL